MRRTARPPSSRRQGQPQGHVADDQDRAANRVGGRGGSIVNILPPASVAGDSMIGYMVSKAAVNRLTIAVTARASFRAG